MNLEEILLGGGGAMLVAMTLIQISPIKLDPWSAIARAIGRAINKEVLAKLGEMEETQADTRRILDDHIKVDDESRGHPPDQDPAIQQ